MTPPFRGTDASTKAGMVQTFKTEAIATTVFHDGTCVILLVQDLQTRVINAATGELLRDPTLEPSRDYQPT